MGFHRLAEKIGLGKSDGTGKTGNAESDLDSADLCHGQDKKEQKDERVQGPPTPPPDYEPAPERQQHQPQQPQQQPPQQLYHQQPQGQPWQPPTPSRAEHEVPRQFPTRFTLYSTNYGFSRTFVIGSDEAPEIYAVRLHSGFSSSAPVVLHNGPDPDRNDVLATVDFASFGGDFTLTLPPMPGQPGGASVVEVEADFGFTNRCYRFNVEVGQPGATEVRTESFEWRHSYGAAVDSLGGSWAGWKLVRTSRGPPPGASGGSPPGQFVTSDGCEVVAVWAGSGPMSFTESARFSFVGTGDSVLLGQRWAVAAVMSALGLWEKERRQRQRKRR
ncbi:hypothetical protein RB595_006892 [Gaeumannomyces hyphopodioides]